MRISDWSSDVCSSDLPPGAGERSDANFLPVAFNERLKRPVCGLERAKQAAAFDHFPVVSNETPGRNRQRDLARARIAHRYRVRAADLRSEERRVGKECVRTCR